MEQKERKKKEWSKKKENHLFILVVRIVVIVDFKTPKPFFLQLSSLTHISSSFVTGLYRCILIKDQVKRRKNHLNHLSYWDRRHFELC